MPRLRAQILACFCAPEPTSPFDLRDRAVNMGRVAAFLIGSPATMTPSDYEALERTTREVKAECERMLFDGLLDKPHPMLMDHHKAPPDEYTLTPLGVSQAMAVYAVATGGKK